MSIHPAAEPFLERLLEGGRTTGMQPIRIEGLFGQDTFRLMFYPPLHGGDLPGYTANFTPEGFKAWLVLFGADHDELAPDLVRLNDRIAFYERTWRGQLDDGTPVYIVLSEDYTPTHYAYQGGAQ